MDTKEKRLIRIDRRIEEGKSLINAYNLAHEVMDGVELFRYEQSLPERVHRYRRRVSALFRSIGEDESKWIRDEPDADIVASWQATVAALTAFREAVERGDFGD